MLLLEKPKPWPHTPIQLIPWQQRFFVLQTSLITFVTMFEKSEALHYSSDLCHIPSVIVQVQWLYGEKSGQISYYSKSCDLSQKQLHEHSSQRTLKPSPALGGLLLVNYRCNNILLYLLEWPTCSLIFRIFLVKIGHSVQILRESFSRKFLRESFKNVLKL